MPSYSDFAKLYDDLMDDFDYPAWADYYLELLRRNGCVPKTLCDCACGTGSLSIPFAKRGIKVTGVDLSAQMLEAAQQKARKNGVQAMFVCQDMSMLTLPRPVDAIVCGCDGVNYLTRDEQAEAFFQRAYASLKPGGVLAFDISSAYKLKKILGNNFFGEEREDVAYLWWNTLKDDIVQMELSFFEQERDGRYRRFTETHRQRAYESETLLALMHKAGFEEIQCFGDRNFEAPAAEEKRLHFAAKK